MRKVESAEGLGDQLAGLLEAERKVQAIAAQVNTKVSEAENQDQVLKVFAELGGESGGAGGLETGIDLVEIRPPGGGLAPIRRLLRETNKLQHFFGHGVHSQGGGRDEAPLTGSFADEKSHFTT
jgi:hypothetical protein